MCVTKTNIHAVRPELTRLQPSAVLAYLARTPTSIFEHGENRDAYWSPDGTHIVITVCSSRFQLHRHPQTGSQTTGSYLVLVSVQHSPNEPVSQSASSSNNTFHAGPGEGFPLTYVGLQFEGVIKVDGTLVRYYSCAPRRREYLNYLSVSPRKHFILFATQNPASVQRVPWPDDDDEDEDDPDAYENFSKRNLGRFDTWHLTDPDFNWLVENEVTVWKIIPSRGSGVETWIMTDGRAYFVRLQDAQTSDEGVKMGSVDGDENQSAVSFDLMPTLALLMIKDSS